MSSKFGHIARSVVIAAFSLAPAAFAAGSVIVTPRDAYAINTCKKVDIKITNSHSSKLPIKILRVEYQVNGSGSWYKEDLANSVLNQGVQGTWQNQKLQNLPEGSAAKFRVIYKVKLTDGVIPKFSEARHQEFDRLNDRCGDGQSYKFTVQ